MPSPIYTAAQGSIEETILTMLRENGSLITRDLRALCGHCQMLHGQAAEDAYADYIESLRPYLDITLELRR